MFFLSIKIILVVEEKLFVKCFNVVLITTKKLFLNYIFFFNYLGLFHKAIMQSGCILNPWALSENHMEIACTLAKQLGCEKKNPKDIIKYLINIPAKDILKCTKFKVSICIFRVDINKNSIKYKLFIKIIIVISKNII